MTVNDGADGFIADLLDQLDYRLALFNIITRIIKSQPFLAFYHSLIAPVITHQRPDPLGNFYGVRLTTGCVRLERSRRAALTTPPLGYLVS